MSELTGEDIVRPNIRHERLNTVSDPYLAQLIKEQITVLVFVHLLWDVRDRSEEERLALRAQPRKQGVLVDFDEHSILLKPKREPPMLFMKADISMIIPTRDFAERPEQPISEPPRRKRRRDPLAVDPIQPPPPVPNGVVD